MCLDQERRISAIDPALREKLRGLVEGRLPWPLYLYGPAGVGKTCAALCLLDYCGGYDPRCQRCGGGPGKYQCPICRGGGFVRPMAQWSYLTAADLSRLLQPGGYERTRVFGDLRLMHVVALDELGVRERVSDHQYEAAKDHLDTRAYSPTIYLSNLGPEQLLEVYDDRIVSRLCAGTVVELQGEDRRLLRD